MSVSENIELLESLLISCCISVVYMVVYLIKGSNKSIIGFFEALLSSVGLAFAAAIPVLLIVLGCKNMDTNDWFAGLIPNVLAVIFSAPFFSELIKSAARDFDLPPQFASNSLNVVVGIIIGLLLTMLLIFFTYGFFVGEVSLLAFFAILCLSVGGISILFISKYKQKFSGDPERLEKVMKIEKKTGVIISVFIIILFILSRFR